MSSSQFNEVVTWDNLLEAMHKSCNGVRWKASTQSYEVNSLRWAASTMQKLKNGKYKCKKFHSFQIYERGKLRKIDAVHISDRAVQKMISEHYIKPALVPTLIYDNSASLKGRGTEFALDRLKIHLQRHYRRHGRIGGILIMDFKDYFGSIDHSILKERLKVYLKDKQLFKIVQDAIDMCKGEKGLGLGSELFQTCAIFYPSGIDHYIKERLHIKGYGRYMDDSYLIHEDVSHLKKCLVEIKKICCEVGIELNLKRTKIYRLTETFHFLKKRITLTDTGKVIMRLERENIVRERRRLKNQRISLSEGKTTIEHIHQSYQSWRGYAKKYDSQKTVENMDKLYKELFGGAK